MYEYGDGLKTFIFAIYIFLILKENYSMTRARPQANEESTWLFFLSFTLFFLLMIFFLHELSPPSGRASHFSFNSLLQQRFKKLNSKGIERHDNNITTDDRSLLFFFHLASSSSSYINDQSSSTILKGKKSLRTLLQQRQQKKSPYYTSMFDGCAGKSKAEVDG